MTVLQDLAAFAATGSIGALEASTRAIQRRHFLDATVAMVAGATSAESRALRPLFDEADWADRAAYRAATARLTEIDDIDCKSCTTPSALAVPLALAIANTENNADPATVADAVWVGTETMTRLGEAIDGAEVLYRGIWPTYFCAPVSAAAVTGRMFGFDASTMTNALSMALTLSAGGTGRQGGGRSSRWILFATAVKAGIFAARAAREGYGGDPTLLDTPDWLANTHGLALNVATVTDRLGETSVYDRLSLKPFCSAKQVIAAVDAFRAILAEGVEPAEISAVEIRVPPPYAGMISVKAVAGNRSSTMVSAAYQLALAADHPDAMNDIDRVDLPWDDGVTALMAKVSVVPDPSLLGGFPERFPASVTVRTAGKSYRKDVTDASGDPGRSLDDTALADKAHRILDPLIGNSAATAWITAGAAGLSDSVALASLAESIDDPFDGSDHAPSSR